MTGFYAMLDKINETVCDAAFSSSFERNEDSNPPGMDHPDFSHSGSEHEYRIPEEFHDYRSGI